MVERWCSEHNVPLLDLTCAYNHEVSSWLVVQDGQTIAACDENGVRWRNIRKYDDILGRLVARDKNGLGGRLWTLDMKRERPRASRIISFDTTY